VARGALWRGTGFGGRNWTDGVGFNGGSPAHGREAASKAFFYIKEGHGKEDYRQEHGKIHDSASQH
jgi:hypothetical protein